MFSFFTLPYAYIQPIDNYPQLSRKAFPTNFLKTLLVDIGDNKPSNYMCNTCRNHVEKGKLPSMAYSNGLQMYNWDKNNEKQFLELNEVAVCLIALNNIFQKIYLLPKSRWSAIKDKLINVPIPESVVQQTVDILPKLPTKAGLIPIKFKS